MQDEHWSRGEKAIARRAYDQAHSRELSALADEVRRRADRITEPHHIWELHDFLSRKRKEIDQKYDCLLYTSPSPRDRQKSRMPSSA